MAAVSFTADGYVNNNKFRKYILRCELYIKRITKTFYYTIFFACHSLGVNTGFVKEALRLLRTNSSRSTFTRKRTEFHDTHKE